MSQHRTECPGLSAGPVSTRSQGSAKTHDLLSPWRDPGPASRRVGQGGQWSPSRGSVSARGGVTYRARQLHPDVRAVQWGVAALPRPPLSRVGPFLVLPAPHGEREQVPAGPPPVPRVVAVSILLLEGGRLGMASGSNQRSPARGAEGRRPRRRHSGAQGKRTRGARVARGQGEAGRCCRSSDSPHQRPPSRAECWVTGGGPEPCP